MYTAQHFVAKHGRALVRAACSPSRGSKPSLAQFTPPTSTVVAHSRATKPAAQGTADDARVSSYYIHTDFQKEGPSGFAAGGTRFGRWKVQHIHTAMAAMLLHFAAGAALCGLGSALDQEVSDARGFRWSFRATILPTRCPVLACATSGRRPATAAQSLWLVTLRWGRLLAV